MSEEQFPILTRVGIIGDVHGQVGPLRTAVTFLRGLSLDALVCTGDLPPKGYTQTVESAMLTNECALLLRDEGVLTVRGNHDRYFVENADDPTLYAMFRAEWDASGDALAFGTRAGTRWRSPGRSLRCYVFKHPAVSCSSATASARMTGRAFIRRARTRP